MNNLNVQQKNVIKTIHRPCLVLAGAGSGKTKVITEKIYYLINKCNYNPSKILAITFTNKAAKEMQDRICNDFIVNHSMSKVLVTTFHALGLKIIQSGINLIEKKSNFSIINENDKKKILKNITRSVLFQDSNLINKLIFFISSLKNNLLDYKNAYLSRKYNHQKDFLYCYSLYEKYLNKIHSLDFDDLVFFTVLLLKKNFNFRMYWKNKISYLLVDEYQDTNRNQYKLITMLTQKNNFTLVGDDDQSIYSWRGSDPKNIHLIKKDFPKIKIIFLEENYRSSKRILNIANTLISNNMHFFKKKMFSNIHSNFCAKIFIAENETDEVLTVINEINSHKIASKSYYGEYAILYRNNYQSKIFEKIFVEKKIPYVIYGNTSIFNFYEIKILTYYIRFIANFYDDVAFLKIVNVPSRLIGKTTLLKLKNFAKENNCSLYNASTNVNFKKILSVKIFDRLSRFCTWIKKISTYDVHKILKKIILEINYKNWIQKNCDNKFKFDTIWKNVIFFEKIFYDICKKEIQKNRKCNLSHILSNILIHVSNDSLSISIDEIKNRVTLMTLHASKGLEFNFVFIVGMEENILPHYISIQNNNIEEERRLAYVGITRAKKQLFLTYSKNRTIFGHNQCSLPSRFINELPKKDIVFIKKNEYIKNNCFIKNKKNINKIKKLLN
ncbi:UvrD-helicase domain-containing protein [Buchnera aphidicola (Kurisakia onigurumii)]|uniref:UvrD-helicase domain-containing protein n=1 Tax=Buchnera aphidicola TaxID=9 RepID=UPI0031B66ED6